MRAPPDGFESLLTVDLDGYSPQRRSANMQRFAETAWRATGAGTAAVSDADQAFLDLLRPPSPTAAPPPPQRTAPQQRTAPPPRRSPPRPAAASTQPPMSVSAVIPRRVVALEESPQSPRVAARAARRWSRPRRGPAASAAERKRAIVRAIDPFRMDARSTKKAHASVPRLSARPPNGAARRAQPGTPQGGPVLRARSELRAALGASGAGASGAGANNAVDPYGGGDDDWEDDESDAPRLNAQQRAARRAAAGVRRNRQKAKAARSERDNAERGAERAPLTPRSAGNVKRFRKRQEKKRKKEARAAARAAQELNARKAKQLEDLDRFARRKLRGVARKQRDAASSLRAAASKRVRARKSKRGGKTTVAKTPAGMRRTTRAARAGGAAPRTQWQSDTSVPSPAPATPLFAEANAAPLPPRLSLTDEAIEHGSALEDTPRMAAARAAAAAARRRNFAAARDSPRAASPHTRVGAEDANVKVPVRIGLEPVAAARAIDDAPPPALKAVGVTTSIPVELDLSVDIEDEFAAFQRASEAMIAKALALEVGEELILGAESDSRASSVAARRGDASEREFAAVLPPGFVPNRDWKGLVPPRRWDDPPSTEEMTAAEREASVSVLNVPLRYIVCESCSQFDSLPLTTVDGVVERDRGGAARGPCRRCGRGCGCGCGGRRDAAEAARQRRGGDGCRRCRREQANHSYRTGIQHRGLTPASGARDVAGARSRRRHRRV